MNKNKTLSHFLTVLFLLVSSTGMAKAPSLHIVVPEKSTLEVSIDRIRIAGHTESENRVFINSGEVKVYDTGAFIGMVDLDIGENRIEIEARETRGPGTKKEIVVKRLPKLKTLPDSPLQIVGSLILPNQPMDLSSGDILYVRFFGTPGGNAAFRIPGIEGIFPMTETEPFTEDGLKGIYQGYYKVAGNERTKGAVEFALTKSGEVVKKESPAAITIDPEKWPRVGEIIAEEAALRSGLGSARLGGAELGFLPQGVRLEISGRAGELYHVRLSSTRDAWIEAELVKLLPQGTWLPRSLAGTASMKVTEGYDEVHIGLETRLPFLFDTEVGSNVLVLDIFGAGSNLTWITNTLDTKQYDSLSWHQVEKDCLRLRLKLKGSLNWGYSGTYKENSNTLVVRIKHPPELGNSSVSPLKDITIALDAGHGGRYCGALGCTGSQEKEVNRQIVNALEKLLKDKGAKVVLTRRSDETIDQQDRYKKALEGKSDIFVSIHANSIGLGSDAAAVRGTSTYYRHACFRPLSVPVYEELLQLGLEPFGNISSFNFYPLKRTEMPGVLVEVAFMSNPEEESLMLKSDFQLKVAKSVLYGIEKFLMKARDERSQ